MISEVKPKTRLVLTVDPGLSLTGAVLLWLGLHPGRSPQVEGVEQQLLIRTSPRDPDTFRGREILRIIVDQCRRPLDHVFLEVTPGGFRGSTNLRLGWLYGYLEAGLESALDCSVVQVNVAQAKAFFRLRRSEWRNKNATVEKVKAYAPAWFHDETLPVRKDEREAVCDAVAVGLAGALLL